MGHNILAAEPLNLLYYLGILSCIYFLGREVFSERVGLLAASIVGVWPTFLLSSTQLMRDSLAIFCFLALMLVLTMLLSRQLELRQSLGLGIAGAVFSDLVLGNTRKHVERGARRACHNARDARVSNDS